VDCSDIVDRSMEAIARDDRGVFVYLALPALSVG
jgi:hypothetical protein